MLWWIYNYSRFVAKSLLKIKARKLRRKGLSIGSIASRIDVSKSTTSLWCRDIELTQAQIEKLLENKHEGIKRGQIISSLIKKRERMARIDRYKKIAEEEIPYLSPKEFFIAGLALYLGEGSKKERRIAFFNSNPEIINFMVRWIRRFLRVPKDRFIFSVLINQIHRKRERKVVNFWSKYLKIPSGQFRKTIFVKAKQNKVYENYNNYYGTLKMRILKSTDLSYKIMGLIERLVRVKIQ